MCNIRTNCCNILQYSPVIPSGSTVQIFTSVVNTPPPTPYLLHWVMRNWTCKKLTKCRAEVRFVQNTTLLFSLGLRYSGELQTLNEASVPHIWQHTDHQQLQASGLTSGGAFWPLLVWHPWNCFSPKCRNSFWRAIPEPWESSTPTVYIFKVIYT